MDNNSQQQLPKETSKVVKKDDVDPTTAPTELQLYDDDRIKEDYYIKYDKYQRTRG